MTDRASIISDFLSASGWAVAKRIPLAGDASARRYERLTDGPGRGRAILMDTGADRGMTERFVGLAGHLHDKGLSVPRILACDPANGLSLIEDLGDALYARILERNPALETLLYEVAVDALAAIQRLPLPSGLTVFDSAQLLQTAAAAMPWYPGLEEPAQTRLLAELETILSPLDATPRVLCLRDYHAENLIWLPERRGARRAGLLDFQDAVAGHPVYDLASLLSDARRDVTNGARQAAILRYAEKTDRHLGGISSDLAALGAQRDLRILTQFARLVRRDGKPRYLNLMPRVWANLQRTLEHPDLKDLRRAVDELVPPPTPQLREGIAASCRRPAIP